MNASEMPMILFTVIAQMCVGAFIILGLIQVFGSVCYSSRTIDRVTDSALLLIGPALVAGLGASMFHMNDVFHVLNVFRHINSSWLSREVSFGVLFAGFGFLFALLQWYKIGPLLLRRLLAFVTAISGIALVVSMIGIYGTLKSAPVWNSWGTPLQFAGTTIILGGLLVATSFIVTREFVQMDANKVIGVHGYRAKRGVIAKLIIGAPLGAGSNILKQLSNERSWYQRVTLDDGDSDIERNSDQLISTSIRWCLMISLIGAIVVLVGMPIFIAQMASQGGVAAQSVHVFSESAAIIRFAFLALGCGLLGMVGYGEAPNLHKNNNAILLIAIVGAFILVFVGEIMGREMFYESLVKVGI